MVNLLQKDRVIDTDDMLITHILIFWVLIYQLIKTLFSEQNIAGWNFISDFPLLLSKSTENKVAPISNSLQDLPIFSFSVVNITEKSWPFNSSKISPIQMLLLRIFFHFYNMIMCSTFYFEEKTCEIKKPSYYTLLIWRI
jgi:hypothetical protein